MFSNVLFANMLLKLECVAGTIVDPGALMKVPWVLLPILGGTFGL
jgi:hypothetical protein